MLGRRIARLAAAALAVVCLWACNTPYIPVPPALAPTFQAITISDGMGGMRKVYEPRGDPFDPAANARFYIYNGALGVGVISKARPDGSYVAPPLDGRPSDPVEIYYQTPKGEVSPTICRKLTEGPANEPCD